MTLHINAKFGLQRSNSFRDSHRSVEMCQYQDVCRSIMIPIFTFQLIPVLSIPILKLSVLRHENLLPPSLCPRQFPGLHVPAQPACYPEFPVPKLHSKVVIPLTDRPSSAGVHGRRNSLTGDPQDRGLMRAQQSGHRLSSLLQCQHQWGHSRLQRYRTILGSSLYGDWIPRSVRCLRI